MQIMSSKIKDTLLYPEAVKSVNSCLNSAVLDWNYLSGITGDGPIGEFEENLRKNAGGNYALALSNCTSALYVSLIAAGVGPGTEVILPSYSWPQTLAPVLQFGAVPVFADIGRYSYNIDPLSVSKLVTKRTKAIVVAHLYGIPADVIALKKIAKDAGCPIIYDAAQGFGAKVNGKSIGSFGDFVALSFGRSKLFSIGEGGALIFQTKSNYEKAISISQHPLRMHREFDNRIKRKRIDGVAMNFRMHPLVAALGNGQFEGFKRSSIQTELEFRFAQTYKIIRSIGLGNILPEIRENATPVNKIFPLILDGQNSVEIQKKLTSNGFEVIEETIQKPLYRTSTMKSMYSGKFKTSIKKQVNTCRNTEQRYSLPQLFINLMNNKN